jgi:predicted kinase
MKNNATLHFFCGKMAAGKSTLARRLAERHGAVLLEEDHFLARLFPGQVHGIADYVALSARIKDALSAPIVQLLANGSSVVLDFPGNTRNQRAWFRQLLEQSGAAHELHFLDVADAVCKRQLRQRCDGLADGAPFTTEAEFDALGRYFDPPADDECFTVVRHVG